MIETTSNVRSVKQLEDIPLPAMGNLHGELYSIRTTEDVASILLRGGTVNHERPAAYQWRNSWGKPTTVGVEA